MAKQRIVYIDFMKGLCILLIVSYHIQADAFGAHTNEMLQSFRIPMYFFLSGLFFKTYNGFFDFSRKKINNLIVPLIFFFLLSVCYVFIELFLKNGFSINETLSQMPRIPIEYNVPLWFLIALFEVNIIYYVLQKFLSHAFVIISAVFLSIIGYFLSSKGVVHLMLFFDIALVALPYFILGTELRKMGLHERGPHVSFRLLMVVVVFVILYFFAETINLYDRVYPEYIKLYLLPCISILALMFICQYIKSPVPVISYCGRYSIIILGTHNLFAENVKCFCTSRIPSLDGTIWLFLIIFSIVIILEYPIIYLMRKYASRLTAQEEFFYEGWVLKKSDDKHK